MAVTAVALIAVAGLVASALTDRNADPERGSDDVVAATPPPSGASAPPPGRSPEVPATPTSELTDPVTCTSGDEVEAAPCPWWTADLGEGPSVGLVVTDQVVAVPLHPHLVGLDVRTGERRWSVPVGPVAGLAQHTDRSGLVVWTADGGLLFLDAPSGRVLWQAPEPVDVADATVSQGWIVAATSTGVRGWQIRGERDPWAVPVSGQPSPLGVGDGVVAVGDGNGDVRLIDVDTGAVRWTAAAGTWTTAVEPDMSVIVTAGFGSPMLGLDPHRGEVAWEAPSVVGWAVPHVVPGRAGAAARHVAVQEAEGEGPLSFVDLATGALVAEIPSPGRLLTTLVGGWVLTVDGDTVRAYDGDRADGAVAWSIDAGAPPLGVPAVAHPRSPEAPLLVFLTADGRVVTTPVPARTP